MDPFDQPRGDEEIFPEDGRLRRWGRIILPVGVLVALVAVVAWWPSGSSDQVLAPAAPGASAVSSESSGRIIGGVPVATALSPVTVPPVAPPAATTPATTVAPRVPSTAPAPAGTAPASGTARPVAVAIDGPVRTLNPWSTSAGALDRGVASLVLPSPFRPGADGRAVIDGDLMTRVDPTVTATGTVIRYVVRPEAVWSNGVPVGCLDFKLAWVAGAGRILRRGTDGRVVTRADGSPVGAFEHREVAGYAKVASVTCAGDGREILVTFAEPDADWPWLFGPLLPAHVVMEAAGVPDLDVLDAAAGERLAQVWNTVWDVATGPEVARRSAGPYRIENIAPDGTVLLGANGAWWARPSAVTALVLRPVPADQRVAALASGTVQVAPLAWDAALADSVRAQHPVDPTLATVAESIVVNFRNPTLQQRAVRRALASCIDPAALAAVPSGVPGAVRLDARFALPFEPGASSTRPVGTVAADAAVARTLLTAAGWQPGPDGVAVRSGVALRLRLAVDAGDARAAAVVAAVSAQCAPAGIAVSPQVGAVGALVAGGDFDLALVRRQVGPEVSSRLAVVRAGDPANPGGYANPALGALVAQASGELDSSRRSELYGRIDATVWADVPSVPIAALPLPVARDPGLDLGVIGPEGLLASAIRWRWR